MKVNFNMQMTIASLVDEMNNGGSQNELYKLSKINKDVIPYLFKYAGYTREKQKYVATGTVQSDLTIEQLLPLAKALHQEVKLAKLQKQVEVPTKAVVIDTVAPVEQSITEIVTTNVGANVNEYSLNFANKVEMQSAILEVLDLTLADLEAIKSANVEKQNGTIYEAVTKLQSRRRANKTYYISEEIAQQVQQFTEAHAIKTSQFVEIALLEAMKKYEK